MARERLSMRKTKEVLRLHLVCGLSARQIARSIQSARSTVADYIRRARQSGITSWEHVQNLDEAGLEGRLFAAADMNRPRENTRPQPDYGKVHEELRNKHVTLMLLWQEHREQHPTGYAYSQYVHHYREYKKTLDLVMRQEHKGGEKLFVDYCDGLFIEDPKTGEKTQTQLFVGVWGASNDTYAEATLSQQLPCWIGSHVNAFEYFGCAPHAVVPDCLKSGVTRACYYEPDINPTYAELAEHYGVAVLPARPRHPRDKAKVEAGVLIAQRWILAALRHRRFYSLSEMNRAIRELLEKLNTRPLTKMKKSRRELFEQIDRPKALPLPARPYEYAEWKQARVNIDYHIEVDRHYYSVPCRLVRQPVDVRLTAATVEIFLQGERVAAHARSKAAHKHTTVAEHMPKSHQHHAEWSPSRIVAWAAKTGPDTAKFVQTILESKPHPEQGYRACLGVLRLQRHYGPERIEAACRRALAFGAISYRSIHAILANGLDKLQPTPPTGAQAALLPVHENIRGSDYYKAADHIPSGGTPC